MPVRRSAAVAIVCALAAGTAACGATEPDAGRSTPEGAVPADAVRGAVLGLCQLATTTELAEAEATFLNRSHATLHAIAAAADDLDRAAVADLLEAKQRVEADLARPRLPETFGADVSALLEATRTAVGALGLEAPACPS